MTVTRHTITATLGGEESALVIDITYTYPGLDIIGAAAVGNDDVNFWTPKYVHDCAVCWINGDGYDAACQRAERQREEMAVR
jgi:hypothetical protein